MTRLIIVQAALIIFQIVVYFGCEIFQHRMHNVVIKLDDKIPFIPATVLIYNLWFPLIVIFPITLYYGSPELYSNYMPAMFIDIVISVIIYLIYPTTFERPVPPDTLMGRLMKFIYKGSFKGVNCAPSLHCSSCFLTIYYAASCLAMPLVLRIVFILIAALITISTVTTKQHAIIDVITALPLAILCIFIGKALPAIFLLDYIGVV